MTKVVPAFDLPTQREEYEHEGLSGRSCSDGHVVSIVSKASNEDISTPETLRKSKEQRTDPDNFDQRSFLHHYATAVDTVPDFPRDKELPEALKDVEANKPVSFTFEERAECAVACRVGVIVGLADGSVANVRMKGVAERRELQGARHEGEVTCLVVTSDGRLALSGGTDKSIRVWNLNTLSNTAVLLGHSQSITCLAATADCKYAVSGSADNTLKVWHLEDCKEWCTFTGHAHIVQTLALSENGKQAASASVDGVVKVWSLEDKREVCTLTGHTDFVTCLCFTADGSQVISGSHDMTIKIWSVDLRRVASTLIGHTRYIECLLLTPDQQFIVSAGADNSIKVWSLSDRKEVATLSGHLEEVRCLAVTHDSKYVISGSQDTTVRVWSLEEMCEVASFVGHHERVSTVATSADGNGVFSLSGSELKSWVLEEQLGAASFDGSIWDVTCITAISDGRSVIAGSSKGEVKLWSLLDMREEFAFAGHSSWVTCLTATASGRFAASGSADSTVKVWDLLRLQGVATFANQISTIECICFSPDDRTLISGSGNSTMKMWSMENMQEIATFAGHEKWLTCTAVTCDGVYIASASADATIRLWHIAEKREVATLIGHTGVVESMIVSPDRKHIITGSADFSVRVWSLESWGEVLMLAGHKDRVKCLAVTADGGHIISGSGDTTIKVWCLLEQRELTTLRGHSRTVNRVEVTASGRCVVSCSEDMTVRVWSLQEGREIAQLSGHMKPACCFALTIDNSRIVLASADRSLLCVNISESELCGLPHTGSLRAVLTPRNIDRLRTGELVPRLVFMSRVLPQNFNSLHISAYYNNCIACGTYLKAGAPVLRGVYGSPLTVAMKRNTSKCVDVILESLAAMCQNDSACIAFAAVVDDLPGLLARNSPFLVPFFHALLTLPSQSNLPQFISPLLRLPATRFFPVRIIHLNDFVDMRSAKTADSQLVEFSVSVIRWNFAPGSAQCLQLLNSLKSCRTKKVLTTDFARTLIDTKWQHFFPLTLTLTFTYLLLLIDMVLLMFRYWSETVFACGFFVLNGLMLVYEIAEVVGFGKAYLRNPWNIVDLLRGVLSIIWTSLLYNGSDPQYLRLAVASLCLLKGFTYFRSFTSTRIFVYMTIQVVKEIYSFLGILAYSVFAFGILASVLHNDDGVLTSWTIAFNLLIGQGDTTDFGFAQWLVFMAANVANVVITLNLLVSILTEAYDKTQLSLLENDLHTMLEVIIEYESILFWKRHTGQPTVMVRCKNADSQGSGEEWVGHINKIVNTVKDEGKHLQQRLLTVEQRLSQTEGNIRSELQKALTTVSKQQSLSLSCAQSRNDSDEDSDAEESSSTSEVEKRDSVVFSKIHLAELERRVSANPLLTAAFFRRTSSNVMGSPNLQNPLETLPSPRRRVSAKAKFPGMDSRKPESKSTFTEEQKNALSEKVETFHRDVMRRIDRVEENVAGVNAKLDQILISLRTRR